MRAPSPAPAPGTPPSPPPRAAAAGARALLAPLLALLLLLALESASPGAASAQTLLHLRSASALGPAPAEAADENVALWLRPGLGLPPGASIDRPSADSSGATATVLCRDAPIAAALTGGLGNNLFVAAFGLAFARRRAGSAAGLALVRTEASDLRGSEVRALERSLFARFRFVDSPGEWFVKLRRERESSVGDPVEVAAARPPGQQLGVYDWRNFCRNLLPEAERWASAPCGTEQTLTGFFQSAVLFRNESALLRRLFAVPEAVAADFRTAFPPPDSACGASNTTSGATFAAGAGPSALNTSAGPSTLDTSAGPRGGVPWAIHVRRGDYVEKAAWHHLLPLRYFSVGIERMLAHLEASGAASGPVFVFSDDIEWVRAQEPFRGLARAVFVAERDPLRAFYQLVLAAEGGVLCSNSTFCWWATFLSELRRRARFKRLVLFPDGWTAEHSLSGFHGPGDCGVELRTEYMTVLDGF